MGRKAELNKSQQAAIDRLFVNGFDRADAYAHGYPESKPESRSQSMYILLQKDYVKEYHARKYEEFKSMISMDKHMMIDNLTTMCRKFDDMIAIASKDKLTAKEEEKLERLSNVLKGSDVMKAKDMICRIIGAYEPEKIEVTNKTWNVSFDDADDAEIVD